MKKTLFRYALMLPLLIPFQSCAFFTYEALPIQAWVVDEKTNQPLEGVIVVAHWQLKGGLEGGNPVGEMMVMETVTDAKGRFYFPRWGPKQRSSEGRLKTKSPGILLFKSGYEFRGLENALTNRSLRGDLDNPLRSDWNGKTITMEKFSGGLKEYAEHLAFLKTSLGFAYNGEECEWKQIPRMIAAQQKERLYFDKKNIFNTLRSVDSISNSVDGQKKCGSAQEFIKGFLP